MRILPDKKLRCASKNDSNQGQPDAKRIEKEEFSQERY
jgi:hypothetical protein